MLKTVVLGDRKDGMLAQHRPFDAGSNGSSNYNPRQYCLIQISDYFLDSEGDSGDRRIECRRDSGRRGHRQEPFQVLTRKGGGATESTRNTRADLHRWPFTSQRGTRPDLQDADQELPQSVAKGHATTFDGIGDFHLWNAASPSAGHHVLQERATEQSTYRGREHRPPNP